jgi:hypothetical protein
LASKCEEEAAECEALEVKRGQEAHENPGCEFDDAEREINFNCVTNDERLKTKTLRCALDDLSQHESDLEAAQNVHGLRSSGRRSLGRHMIDCNAVGCHVDRLKRDVDRLEMNSCDAARKDEVQVVD